MLISYSFALAYYVEARGLYKCLHYGWYGCDHTAKLYKSSYMSASIGIAAFLVVLILSELACSIAAVVFSCRAYSKCCNTCLFNDCGTCVGCCECSMATTATASYQVFFIKIYLLALFGITKFNYEVGACGRLSRTVKPG